MDAGLTIRPSQSVAQSSYARADIAPAQQAVATDIPKSQAVTAAVAVQQARNDARRADTVTRELIVDEQSRAVIYRVIDQSSRQVVQQVPDQAMLRLRAYTRALRDGENTSAAMLRADIVT
jgi:uncharacterized FlaG/YvyC family protein